MTMFKRIVAGTMSLVMSSAMSVIVNANTTTKSSGDTYWSVDYIQGAPSSVSTQICTINVGPFPYGFNIDCVTLGGLNPVVTMTSPVIEASLTIDKIGSYQFAPITTQLTAFDMTFKASAPTCKGNGYVYSR